jgi:hypothetical protein
MTADQASRTLLRNAALLIVIGLLTGILLGAAMTDKLDADVHAVVAAHLNALLGCFWMAAVAYSMPMLRFGDRGRARMVWLVTVPNFANWAVTLVKSFLKVAGVAPDDNASNNGIFGALTLLVVIPSLLAAIVWLWGLSGRRD